MILNNYIRSYLKGQNGKNILNNDVINGIKQENINYIINMMQKSYEK